MGNREVCKDQTRYDGGIMANNEIYMEALLNVQAFMQQLHSLSLSRPDAAVKLYDKHGKKLNAVMQTVLSDLAKDIGLEYEKTKKPKQNPRALELFSGENMVLPFNSSPASAPADRVIYANQGPPPPSVGKMPEENTPDYQAYYNEHYYDNQMPQAAAQQPGGTPIGGEEVGGMLAGGGVTNRAATANTGPVRQPPMQRIPTDENGNLVYPD